jgi:glycosyltransferase involved in cell wall biosynthesis
LIEAVNGRCGAGRVAWRFMGMPGKMRAAVSQWPNVEAVPEHTRPVADFLRELDVFAFFTSWKREEPWSRSVAEALMSGCPVVATPRGGNRDQIVSGNNGLLVKTFEQFVDAVELLAQENALRARMSAEAVRRSAEYTSEQVIRRFVQFVEG